MPHRLPSLNAMRAFEAAARLGSFHRAAEELSVTQSAISHQVRNLESHLGVELFRRNGTHLELTEAGRAYLPRLSGAFAQIEQATRSVARYRSSNRLTVQTYSTIAIRWLIPRLSGFREQHPEVDVRLLTSQADVDLATDDVDLGLVVGSIEADDVQQERLFTPVLFPVCSPMLLEGKVPLRSPDDLKRHTILQVYPSHADWDYWLAQAGVTDVDPDSGLRFDSYDHALATACRGLGVALGMEPYVRDDVAAGLLVQPFPELQVPSPWSWHLVYRSEEAERPQIVRFRRWLVTELERDPATRGLRLNCAGAA
ncbi:MAG: transcriptional regulator GcvA [Pseudomonadales bacterium]